MPDIPLFSKNTAAFVHEAHLSNADGDTNYVRMQVLTNAGALDRDKQLAAVHPTDRGCRRRPRPHPTHLGAADRGHPRRPGNRRPREHERWDRGGGAGADRGVAGGRATRATGWGPVCEATVLKPAQALSHHESQNQQRDACSRHGKRHKFPTTISERAPRPVQGGIGHPGLSRSAFSMLWLRRLDHAVHRIGRNTNEGAVACSPSSTMLERSSLFRSPGSWLRLRSSNRQLVRQQGIQRPPQSRSPSSALRGGGGAQIDRGRARCERCSVFRVQQ